MAKFRKLPVVIDAVHVSTLLEETSWRATTWPTWAVEAFDSGTLQIGNHSVLIKTLEGDMVANVGDWVIRGVKGELYPCKPDIFIATYEPVPSASSSAAGS